MLVKPVLAGYELLTLRASHNHAAMRRNIDTGHRLVMAFEFILEREFRAGSVIQFDIVVSCNGQRLSICGEGMVGDGMMEEVVDFGSRHGRTWDDRRSSLLSSV